MKKYCAICFDFDYTLGDSTDSIVAGFQYGFAQLGKPIPDRETVRGTIGYLLEDAYTLLTGDEDEAHKARFRAYFLEVAKPRQREETTLFAGAEELTVRNVSLRQAGGGQPIARGITFSVRRGEILAVAGEEDWSLLA